MTNGGKAVIPDKPKIPDKTLKPYKQKSKLGTVEVTCTALNVRSGPGIANGVKSTLKTGDQVEVDDYKNGWYHIKGSDNWMSASPRYSKVTSPNDTAVPNKTIKEKEEVKEEVKPPDNTNMIDVDLAELYNEDYTGEPIKRLHSVIGMPHQFLPSTDTRIGGNQYGRHYAQTIYANAPIVHIIPGKPDFMSTYTIKQKESLLNLSLEKDRTAESKKLDQILDGKNGKYFDFKADYATRVIYLNALNSVQSIYLGIGNEYYPGTKQKLKDFNWHKQNVESQNIGFFTKLFGINPTISFFMDADLSATMSASNSTTKSKLDSGMNALSDTARELQFVTGAASLDIEMISSEHVEDQIANINNKMVDLENPNSLMNRIKQGTSVTIRGGKLDFPEMWSEFEMGKEISIPFKFKSPYGNPKSIFLHVLEPLNEVLTIVLGRQMTANAYTSPFLVRVYSKGWANIDMGIVTSMTVDKGDHTNWTVDNLPTELKVTLNIKPLYHRISLSRQDNTTDLLNNVGLLDEMATLAGVDLNKPSVTRKLTMYTSQLTGTFKHGLDLFQSVPDLVHSIKNNFSR